MTTKPTPAQRRALEALAKDYMWLDWGHFCQIVSSKRLGTFGRVKKQTAKALLARLWINHPIDASRGLFLITDAGRAALEAAR